jgi:hypothetical protein
MNSGIFQFERAMLLQEFESLSDLVPLPLAAGAAALSLVIEPETNETCAES